MDRCKNLLYNRKTMDFLKTQLDMAEMLQPQKAPAAMIKKFVWHLEKGRRLLAKHPEPFDILKFYRTEEACNGVEETCTELRNFLWELGVECKQLEAKASIKSVYEDRLCLNGLLEYILRDKRPVCDEEILQH